MGKYIVRNGVLAGRKFRLEPGARIHIGREKGDLNFPDKRMSRRHCTLEVREEGDFIEDAGSTNGTFVNDEKVKLRHLKRGDIIRVGFTEIEFLGMPEHTSIALTVEPGQRADPNKTIAFRKSDLEAAIAARPKPRRRSRTRSRLDDVKKAAMGIGGVKLISAKGKFCEACGEAIFMKEGAPDEGRVIDGLYLCRMCALIAEKQHEIGGDFLPSFAKIVGGRMPGEEAPSAVDAGGGAVEIVSVDEVSLDDLTGEAREEKAEEEKPKEVSEATIVGNGEGVKEEPEGEVEEVLEEEPEKIPGAAPEEKLAREAGEEAGPAREQKKELGVKPAVPTPREERGGEREGREEGGKQREAAGPGPGGARSSRTGEAAGEKPEAPPPAGPQADARPEPAPEAQPEGKAPTTTAERDVGTKRVLTQVDAAIKPTEEGEARDPKPGGDGRAKAGGDPSGEGERAAGSKDENEPGKPGDGPILPGDLRLGG